MLKNVAMKNIEKIKLNTKKLWQIAKGHHPHHSGAGKHITLPHKGTRGDKNRRAIQEQ